MLREKIARTQMCLMQANSTMAVEIGGMGIINTYARLFLLYGDTLSFELKNTTPGAMVRIGNSIG